MLLYIIKTIPKYNTIGFLIIILTLLFQGCKEDPYYARPESLEPVIYKQLVDKGNFTSYLNCLDRAGYKDILNRAGFFTVFAPTDEAFNSFLSANNYNSVDDIDIETVKQLVNYSIVYNAYSKDQLDDYQSTDSSGWIKDISFKRRTTYYKWVYPLDISGTTTNVVDMNAVGPEDSPAGSHRASDYNNKHIPYFTDNYLSKKNLSEYDYNYFFPQTNFSGFNVVDAQVVEKDLFAENGVLHTVDKVIMPLPSLDELIGSKPEYSEFKRLLDEYLVEYNYGSSDLHNKYAQATGNREDIYVKAYPTLNFAPNCENFLKYGQGEDYDAQMDGWTIFVPTNSAIQNFYDSKFLEHYESVDEIPQKLISEFVNAHLFRTTVWPSKFNITLNPFGEPARFDPASNVIDKQVGSNGMFYGVDKVQETDGFYTLLGDIYLNPEYSLMLQALYTTSLYAIVKNTNFNLTIFMIPNEGFEELGFSYDETINTWSLESEFLGNNAMQALLRIMNMTIIVNKNFDDFSGTGFIQTYGEEYIRYDEGFILSVGNGHNGESLVPKNKKVRSNGNSFVLANLPYYTTENIGRDIEDGSSNAYGKFYQYLEKSGVSLPGFLYDPIDKSITNLAISTPHTLIVPVDTAIDGAVRDGYLPPITAAFFTEEEQDMVAKFVYYHTLKGIIIVPENEVSGEVKTLYKTLDGSTYVTVSNENGKILFFDKQGNTSEVINPYDNGISKLSNNAIIYSSSNYLRY